MRQIFNKLKLLQGELISLMNEKGVVFTGTHENNMIPPMKHLDLVISPMDKQKQSILIDYRIFEGLRTSPDKPSNLKF